MYVLCICIIYNKGIDLKKRFLNVHGLRLVMMSVILLCLSVLLFFCVTIWNIANDNDVAGYGLEATGYFIIMLLIPVWIGIKLYLTPMNHTQIKIDLGVAIILYFCVLLIVLGYFVLSAQSTILKEQVHIGLDLHFISYPMGYL